MLYKNAMSQKEKNLPLHKKVAMVARALEISQTKLADRSGISRVPLNRFLRGQSELRAGDFVRLMHALDINIEEILHRRLLEIMGDADSFSQLSEDFQHVFEQLTPMGRRSFIANLLAHAELLGVDISEKRQSRLLAFAQKTGDGK